MLHDFFIWENNIPYPRLLYNVKDWTDAVNNHPLPHKKLIWELILVVAKHGERIEPRPLQVAWGFIRGLSEFMISNLQ